MIISKSIYNNNNLKKSSESASTSSSSDNSIVKQARRMVEKKPENRGSMFQGRYEKEVRLSNSDVVILGERDFIPEEEEKREIEELKMVQELTQSISEI